jgi:hypothetical protein
MNTAGASAIDKRLVRVVAGPLYPLASVDCPLCLQ